MAKEQLKTFTTPVAGIVEPYAWLNKADTKFNERGEHKVNLTFDLSNPKVRKMIDVLQKIHDDAYAKALADHEKNPPQVQRGKKPIEPREGDMPWIENGDGTVTLKFKCFASYLKDGKSEPIVLRFYDTDAKLIRDVPNIGAGSKLKVKFKVLPFKWNAATGASVKLQLESCLLVELKEWKGDGAGGDGGWGDDEDLGTGYKASTDGDFGDDDFGDDGSEGGDDSNSGGDYNF
ncbi:single-stranded DNA-binding protein [Escherichia phage TM1]|uniref:Single-stranded DNA-binding protein n=1 Tax=Escherichia phage TM1 TaxID=2762279 RepID=A0ABY4XT93_9CAUD|nr:single-stranded DNA-binding protein [Escherichia phage TM1]